VKTVERDMHAVEIEQRGSRPATFHDAHAFTPPGSVR
jgi:hypothetical protein